MANRPVHEIRLGKVKAAIWKNETDAGIRYSVSIVRRTPSFVTTVSRVA